MTGGMTQPLVYFFGQGRADGTAAMKDLLGGKGAGLAEMTNIGIPVPPVGDPVALLNNFTLPTDLTITEDVIRAIVLPIGLVDVKVCAVDSVWSGLKLVIRKELRPGR